MTNILIVDDDQNILNLVNIHLSEQGYKIYQAKDGLEALKLFQKETFQLAVVDIMMPFLNGYELTKEIRKNYNIPIILLTAKDQIDDKEQGFQAGTDDYLVKPFEPKELSFRIKALLRRYEIDFDEDLLRIGSTIINKRSYEVQIEHRTILLPLKEFELLYFLLSHPMQVFTRNHLIGKIWGIDYEGDERTVDVHIKRLRERFTKLTNDFQIKPVRGVGYLLEANR